jgi:hypothetical protein
MNPEYLWLTDAMQLLTFFVIGPALAIAITYRAWRGKPQSLNLERYGMLCVTSGVAGLLLFGFAKWINADVRTAQYFLQVACVLLSGLLLGVFMGCGWSLLLRLWQWHKATRLAQSGRADEPEIHKS